MLEAQTNVEENYDTGLAMKNTFTLSKFNVTSYSDFACIIINTHSLYDNPNNRLEDI